MELVHKIQELKTLLQDPEVQNLMREVIGIRQATLTFPLPEDEYEFKAAIKSMDIVAGCHEFRNLLRNWIKHDHDMKSANEAIEIIYSRYYDLIESEIPEG